MPVPRRSAQEKGTTHPGKSQPQPRSMESTTKKTIAKKAWKQSRTRRSCCCFQCLASCSPLYSARQQLHGPEKKPEQPQSGTYSSLGPLASKSRPVATTILERAAPAPRKELPSKWKGAQKCSSRG